MRGNRKNSRRAGLLVLALALLLGACGGAGEAQMVDGRTTLDGTIKLGQTLETEALVYLDDGRVLRQKELPEDGVTGVMVNPPELTVMDAYGLTERAVNFDAPLLFVYLDGFGWQRFLQAWQDGCIPNLTSLAVWQAASMYPTITPVNYAAMVTGEVPAVNGVTQRGIHDLQCDTIFDLVADRGGSVRILEGDTQILNFSVPQELHPDLNGNGDTDDEVMAAALEAAEAGDCDLLFVHLHGIDDTSHAYGPDSPELQAKIEQTDAWFGQMLDVWHSRIIVVADHGQHANNGSGDAEYADKAGEHGAFAGTDILVPLLVWPRGTTLDKESGQP